MSQENVETVRKALKAFDAGGLDAVAEFWHPAIDWRAIEGAPDDVGVFAGHDAMRRYYGEWLEMFDARSEAEEFIDAGDRVVVVQHVRGVSRLTEMAVDMRLAVVYSVEGRQIIRGREYASRAEALKAVGLEEHAVSQDNVEIVKRAYASSGPLTDSAVLTPDAEFDFTALYPDQPVLRGVDEMRAFRDTGPWGQSTGFQPERFLRVDDETVLVFVRATAKGRGSGAPIEARIAHEITLRDGMIVRVKIHPDQAGALKAVGLEE